MTIQLQAVIDPLSGDSPQLKDGPKVRPWAAAGSEPWSGHRVCPVTPPAEPWLLLPLDGVTAPGQQHLVCVCAGGVT